MPQCAGTVCLFFPGYDFLSALLYTIGSCGFLSVDVQAGGGAEGLAYPSCMHMPVSLISKGWMDRLLLHLPAFGLASCASPCHEPGINLLPGATSIPSLPTGVLHL